MDHLDPGQARQSGSELRGHGKRTQAGVEYGWDSSEGPSVATGSITG